jgi:hypothetical protein
MDGGRGDRRRRPATQSTTPVTQSRNAAIPMRTAAGITSSDEIDAYPAIAAPWSAPSRPDSAGRPASSPGSCRPGRSARGDLVQLGHQALVPWLGPHVLDVDGEVALPVGRLAPHQGGGRGPGLHGWSG